MVKIEVIPGVDVVGCSLHLFFDDKRVLLIFLIATFFASICTSFVYHASHFSAISYRYNIPVACRTYHIRQRRYRLKK